MIIAFVIRAISMKMLNELYNHKSRNDKMIFNTMFGQTFTKLRIAFEMSITFIFYFF